LPFPSAICHQFHRARSLAQNMRKVTRISLGQLATHPRKPCRRELRGKPATESYRECLDASLVPLYLSLARGVVLYCSQNSIQSHQPRRQTMAGILLTLIAVLLVICLAFYFFDPNPDERFGRIEQLFFVNPRGSRRGKGGIRGSAERDD